jgi:phosphatidylserine/phosphatidylglycerophosphate/cardiolipin synthase-like enzyme
MPLHMRTILKLAFAIILVSATICFGQDNIRVLFSPKGGCRAATLSEISKSQKSIDIAMFHFTSSQIAEFLVKAKKRGVKVRIVLDKSPATQARTQSGYLRQEGIALRFHAGQGLMHHKYTVIDGKLLITGSYNWTSPSEKKNEEALLLITDENVIQKFQERFEYLWKGSKE